MVRTWHSMGVCDNGILHAQCWDVCVCFFVISHTSNSVCSLAKMGHIKYMRKALAKQENDGTKLYTMYLYIGCRYKRSHYKSKDFIPSRTPRTLSCVKCYHLFAASKGVQRFQKNKPSEHEGHFACHHKMQT